VKTITEIRSVPTFFMIAFGLTIALLKRDYEKRHKKEAKNGNT